MMKPRDRIAALLLAGLAAYVWTHPSAPAAPPPPETGTVTTKVSPYPGGNGALARVHNGTTQRLSNFTLVCFVHPDTGADRVEQWGVDEAIDPGQTADLVFFPHGSWSRASCQDMSEQSAITEMAEAR
jgi:hypothetical protein